MAVFLLLRGLRCALIADMYPQFFRVYIAFVLYTGEFAFNLWHNARRFFFQFQLMSIRLVNQQ